MAILSDENLAAEAVKRAGFRLTAIATKLNRSEHYAFKALASRRGQKPADLLRQLVLAELARDVGEKPVSAELVEIVGVRLMLTNLLRPLATGERLTPEIYDGVVAKVKERKRVVAIEAKHEVEDMK